MDWADVSKAPPIHLVGPGGAGKSTTGAALALELGLRFVDLDLVFLDKTGDIDAWISKRGYEANASANVANYLDLIARGANDAAPRQPNNHRDSRRTIFAMSSGFMTYDTSIHPGYEAARTRLENDPWTLVLLPSLTKEVCVVETVRRQMSRPYLNPNATREEETIRRRFDLYSTLKARKIVTMRPIAEIVSEIIAAL